ncbi:MAG: cyclase family protein [Planctomycetes bacterium]|nr:cyclase family protein [Planctomycetota bacterium]
MHLSRQFVALACAMTAAYPQSAVAQSTETRVLVDLTHSFDETTIYWPTEQGFKLLRGPAGITEGGYYYAANRFACAEHGGTHIDAPIHFWKSGQTVDQIPLERLVGLGACIDVSQKCAMDRDYQVTVEDFEAWEAANEATLERRIVVIRTGFARYWPDREKYLGTSESGRAAVAKLSFPGLDPSAADWLITRRRIRMVGIDTASIDHGQTRNYPTHQRLFRDNVPALENVANTDRLPANKFRIVALPMKIGGGSGAPCRVVAILDE